MKKNNVMFSLRLIGAIALIFLGISLMGAYIAKELPFGIECDSTVLLGMWAYTGVFIAVFTLVGGIMLLFKGTIQKWIDSNLL